MQLSDVVMVYFVLGAVMIGGGALALDPPDETGAGIVNFFVEEDASGIQPADGPSEELSDTGGAISSIVTLAVGVALLVWNLIQNLITYLTWPIMVLYQNDAPPMAVLLIGGGFTVAFFMGVVGILWRSA